MTKKLNLVIRQGETFQRVIRWERPPFVYKAITAITRAGPVQITAPGHELTSGWRVAVVTAGGMDEINAGHNPPRDNEFHQATALNGDNITINDINSSDFSPYTSGGYLQYYTPVDLTGYTAEIDIKDKIGGSVLLTLGTTNGRILLDQLNHTISLFISAEDTDSVAMTWKRGVWDLEMTAPTGQVTTLFSGAVSVVKEVTTVQ